MKCCFVSLGQSLRPSLDAVPNLLQLRLTVARQKQNSDSDVVPGSYQIQDLRKPRNNFSSTHPRNTIPPKCINIINFMSFVWGAEARRLNCRRAGVA